MTEERHPFKARKLTVGQWNAALTRAANVAGRAYALNALLDNPEIYDSVPYRERFAIALYDALAEYGPPSDRRRP